MIGRLCLTLFFSLRVDLTWQSDRKEAQRQPGLGARLSSFKYNDQINW